MNAAGLKGFLVPGVVSVLIQANETKKLEEVAKFQHIEFSTVLQALRDRNTVDEKIATL